MLPGIRSASILCLILLCCSPGAQADTPEWEAQDADDGPGYRYRVFTQDAEGEDFARYQVRGTIEATPQQLRDSVRVIAASPDRAPTGHTRRMIEATPGTFLVHTNIEIPFLADRDIVTLGVGSEDAESGTLRIAWRAVDDERAPLAPDVVRIRKAAGFWEFAPQGPGTTQVTYETYIDLGGSIPMWVVNAMMPSMVAGNFVDVADEAQKPVAQVGAPPPRP